jgi:Flp pilus assembly protein TadD
VHFEHAVDLLGFDKRCNIAVRGTVYRRMRRILQVTATFLCAMSAAGVSAAGGAVASSAVQVSPRSPVQQVDLRTTDGTVLKASYYAAAHPGPGVLLLHQVNLERLQRPGGAAHVTKLLAEARRGDPQAQVFPEITASIVGADYQRAGDTKSAIEVFKLIVLAYPDSADAHSNLADACLAEGQKEQARQHAEKALALLDAHATPASS